jgi:tetratricopeptide (TPR) repeat protein
VWVVLALAVAAAAGGGWYAWYGNRVPDRAPPEVVLDGVDPAIAGAIRKAREEVLKSPRSAAAWGELGEVLDANLFRPEAAECYAQAERLDPNEPRWPYHHGMILYADEPEAALVKLRRAAELAPEKPDAVTYRLAELLLLTGRPEEARQRYEAMLRVDPSHPLAWLGLARVALAAGDLDGAAGHAGKVVNSPFARKAACNLLAEVRHRKGDMAGAVVEQDRAAAAPPDRPWPDPFRQGLQERRLVGETARLVRATRLMDRHDQAAAAVELRQLVTDYPASAEGWTKLGYALLMLQDGPGAEKALAEAIRVGPAQPRPYFYLGIVLHGRGDRAGAAARFREAIAAKPDYTLAHFNLGMTLKEDGKRAEAIEAFRDALRCQPMQAPAHSNLGELLLQEGRTDEAREHLEEAVRLNPKDKRAAELLAGLKK